ncbi:Class II abasic (AP) endonuclease [Conoideocrella luteorostrata]|uniref:Class II abasic (AP) endonuclease n=1 Tax=Conoideocrella luteorostrata TaxID=1105319 RepID=A0AAJ0CR68_9HYPO|nr:Class II abasic (AP) endonuclease [Conoideocrella luteorostrata]
MFDLLQSDIVIMQETKIQRKDLQDDMVLVPGWDVFFSLPKYKKGYSGVAIYTRNSTCAPIRAEEGITGVLHRPRSTRSFRDLPPDQQIGGYPRPGQLSGAVEDAVLDSEGRCVILEFPAFVLLGVYSPANRDESRDEFRTSFFDALDVRVRNLAAMGKQVVLAGDLNVIRTEMDATNVLDKLHKENMTLEEWMALPTRRIFNQLLFEGAVPPQDRDEGREKPVLWDLCRSFHPDRLGMNTCWDTKRNTRPANNGSRIDYILCTDGLKDWFTSADIQEGLMGSDHCPVFATISDSVSIEGIKGFSDSISIDGVEGISDSISIEGTNDTNDTEGTKDPKGIKGRRACLLDVMNPRGVFKQGTRARGLTSKPLLPLSAKLIPEFDGRRSIREMFSKRAALALLPPPLPPQPRIGYDAHAAPVAAHSQDRLLAPTLDSSEPTSMHRRHVSEITQSTNDSDVSDILLPQPLTGYDAHAVPAAAYSQVRPPTPTLDSPSKHRRHFSEVTQSSDDTDVSETVVQPLQGTNDDAHVSGILVHPTQNTNITSAHNTEQIKSAHRVDFQKRPSESLDSAPPRQLKRARSHAAADSTVPTQRAAPGQKTLTGFFKPVASSAASSAACPAQDTPGQSSQQQTQPSQKDLAANPPTSPDRVFDPIENKESWSKLLGKRVAPRCEHGEPCISLLTKKPGVNCVLGSRASVRDSRASPPVQSVGVMSGWTGEQLDELDELMMKRCSRLLTREERKRERSKNNVILVIGYTLLRICLHVLDASLMRV